MPSESKFTTDAQGNVAVRVVSQTEALPASDPNWMFARDTNGNIAVRVVGEGGGGGGGAVDSVNGKTGVVVLDAEDVGAQAKTAIVTVSTSTLTQELADNTIYNCGTLSALTVTYPATMDAGYLVQINFTSGATATTLSAPAGTVWRGSDVDSNGFTPVANKRYSVLFFYDGTQVRGLVMGA